MPPLNSNPGACTPGRSKLQAGASSISHISSSPANRSYRGRGHRSIIVAEQPRGVWAREKRFAKRSGGRRSEENARGCRKDSCGALTLLAGERETGNVLWLFARALFTLLAAGPPLILLFMHRRCSREPLFALCTRIARAFRGPCWLLASSDRTVCVGFARYTL